nr:MAG TPA: hypothetical protein [Caudoviricetes sp.]
MRTNIIGQNLTAGKDRRICDSHDGEMKRWY